MPIVRKTKTDYYFNQLQERIERLKIVMQSIEPNANLWNHYTLSEDDYKRDFTEIDQSHLSVALNDVETTIRELKKTKTLKAEKLHTTK